MVDLHSPTAPTIARKEAARAARKAYEKRKRRQVAPTRVVWAASVTRAAPALSLSAQPLNLKNPLGGGTLVELELELIQTQMTQKPILRAEGGARV
jgi:hypothetical protein